MPRLLALSGVMINGSGGVIGQFPARGLYGDGERGIFAWLSSVALKPLVEAEVGEGLRTEAHVGSLQKVDLANLSETQVMIADHSTIPLDPADYRGLAVVELVAIKAAITSS